MAVKEWLKCNTEYVRGGGGGGLLGSGRGLLWLRALRENRMAVFQIPPKHTEYTHSICLNRNLYLLQRKHKHRSIHTSANTQWSRAGTNQVNVYYSSILGNTRWNKDRVSFRVPSATLLWLNQMLLLNIRLLTNTHWAHTGLTHWSADLVFWNTPPPSWAWADGTVPALVMRPLRHPPPTIISLDPIWAPCQSSPSSILIANHVPDAHCWHDPFILGFCRVIFCLARLQTSLDLSYKPKGSKDGDVDSSCEEKSSNQKELWFHH